ncbi:MAG: AAA family ATPase [Desulfobulbus sp.]|nr:AAA family ATPase [Desulfobulbus sp.]
MILDILAGKRLVKLIGRAGSGKTTLCRMVVDRLPSEYQVIMLRTPVDSFDSLMKEICLELGMDPRGRQDTDYLEVFPRLLERRIAEHIKLVLIIDDAEKLYLATLERLLQCISDFPEELSWTTLLVGSPGLDAHLDQLSVFCNSIDIHTGYFLDELTAGETRQYLYFSLQTAGMQREEAEELFDEEGMDRIIAAARGNIGMINTLAREVVYTSGQDQVAAEQSVALEPASSEEEEDIPGWEEKVHSVWEFLSVHDLWELLSANRLLTALLIGVPVLFLVTGVFLWIGDRAQESPPVSATDQQKAAAVSEGTADNARIPSSSAGLRSAETGEESVKTAAEISSSRDGDRLYRERLGASASWLTGIHSGKYTIQLLTVSSDTAQTIVGDTLKEDEFYTLLNELYVFRKRTTPLSVFVYYGLYDSLDAAREARNNMPVYLRKHHPYPLAVDDVLNNLAN